MAHPIRTSSGGPQGGSQELETLLGFDPPDRDELLRRFSSLATPAETRIDSIRLVLEPR